MFVLTEVQELMGSLLYMKQGIHNSPYAFLLDPIYWDEICDVFTRDACALMGMSVESPLSVRYCTALAFVYSSFVGNFHKKNVMLRK